MAKRDAPKVYDRQSRDLPINSRVAEAVVDDPIGDGSKLKVLRSVRDDPLAAMHSRRQIDDAMLAAGREWQRHHEDSEFGSICAIDTTKEAVDGGRMRDILTDRQAKAVKALKAADKELGQLGSILIRKVLGGRESITEVAVQHHYTTAREIDFLSRRFRECLETLAKLWGYA
jgi:hypothetical protein